MKDLGEANFILGMKITKTCDGIYLDQSHYIEKILKKQNFLDCKHVATLFDSSVHLFTVKNDNDIINQKEYASIIGSLCYMQLIVLDLTLLMQQEYLVDLLANQVEIIGMPLSE